MKDNLNTIQRMDLLLDLKNKIKIDPSFVNSSEFINLPFMKEVDLSKVNNSLASLDGNCVYFTSGTTGKPKAVYYTKADINFAKRYISWMCKIEEIPKGSTVAVLMDQSF
jgi:phenylacetate-coenzyme A ligase PaaK-like adenylate-forming protein